MIEKISVNRSAKQIIFPRILTLSKIKKFVVLFFMLIPLMAYAEPPPLIPIQGVLTDNNGIRITGEKSLTFFLYHQDTGGTPFFTETQNVVLHDGIFTAYLGKEEELDLATFKCTEEPCSSNYLGISIDNDDELTPRLLIATAPYSAYSAYSDSSYRSETSSQADTSTFSEDSDELDGMDSDEFARFEHNHPAEEIEDNSLPGRKLMDNSVPLDKLEEAVLTPNSILNPNNFEDNSIPLEKLAESVLTPNSTLNPNNFEDSSIPLEKLAESVLTPNSTLDPNNFEDSSIPLEKLAETILTPNSTLDPNNFDDESIPLEKLVRTSRVVISPVGDQEENGLKLLDTVETVCNTASEENRKLIHINPGVYNLGNQGIDMCEFLTIEGSGRVATLVTSSRNIYGTFRTANNSELRSMRIENTATSNLSCGVLVDDALPIISDIDSIANQEVNINNVTSGIRLKDSEDSMEIKNSYFEGTYGIHSINSIVILTSIRTSGIIGIYSNNSDTFIRDSSLYGEEATFVNYGCTAQHPRLNQIERSLMDGGYSGLNRPYCQLIITYSEVRARIQNDNGLLVCLFSYDNRLNILNEDCSNSN